MHAVRLPRPAALATVLVLLAVAIIAFPREAHGQVGGRVLNPNGVKPTASTVLVTVKGPDGESTRPVVEGRFKFPSVPHGTRVTIQAMAQGLVSAPVTATAPDTMVVLVLRPTRAGEKFDIVQQGAQTRARVAAATPTPAATPPAATPPAATPAAATSAAEPDSQAAATPEQQAPQQQPQQAAQARQQGTSGAAPSAQGLMVQDALFTVAELVNREPASFSGCTAAACSTRYPDTVGTITFWTRLKGGAPGRWVEHVWFHGETEIARVRQKVEAATWRTWTRKTILPEWTGDWRVEVRADDGTLLAERFFTIDQTP